MGLWEHGSRHNQTSIESVQSIKTAMKTLLVVVVCALASFIGQDAQDQRVKSILQRIDALNGDDRTALEDLGEAAFRHVYPLVSLRLQEFQSKPTEANQAKLDHAVDALCECAKLQRTDKLAELALKTKKLSKLYLVQWLVE